jgi:hypothetical protein
MLKERTLTPLMQKEDFRYVQIRNPHKIRKELLNRLVSYTQRQLLDTECLDQCLLDGL